MSSAGTAEANHKSQRGIESTAHSVCDMNTVHKDRMVDAEAYYGCHVTSLHVPLLGTHYVSRAGPCKHDADKFEVRNAFLDRSKYSGEGHMLLIMSHNLQWEPCVPRSRAINSGSLCRIAPFPHIERVKTVYFVRNCAFSLRGTELTS